MLPAGTFTVDDTLATDLSLESWINMPPLGAGPVNVTVPREILPPTTVPGFTLTERTTEGLIVNRADAVDAPIPAVTVTVFWEAIDTVVTVNEALVCPSDTVTVPGIVMYGELVVTKTALPPRGAIPLRVRVPTTDLPPETTEGFRVSDATPRGINARLAACDDPFKLAVITAMDAFGTIFVVTEKVCIAWPAANFTDVGTAAEVLLLLRVTTRPPAPATFVNATTPDAVLPSTANPGDIVTASTDVVEIVSIAVWANPLYAAVITALP